MSDVDKVGISVRVQVYNYNNTTASQVSQALLMYVISCGAYYLLTIEVHLYLVP